MAPRSFEAPLEESTSGRGGHRVVVPGEVMSASKPVPATLELDTEQRAVDIPPELAERWASTLSLFEARDKLSFTARKERWDRRRSAPGNQAPAPGAGGARVAADPTKEGRAMRRIRVLLVFVAVLVLAACNPGDDEGGDFDIELSGANEVCEGDTCGGDGTGSAEVEINSDENEVCYDIELEGVENVTMAHIHSGSADEAGPVVVNLEYAGDDSGGDACVDGVEESILEDISEDPANFYVNVHSERYPDGAVRGQLAS
jgi:hypothetical protein